MTAARAATLARCCAHHDSWQQLAAHLLLDFPAVSARNITLELEQAKRAVERFELDDVDALDCAELIVRNRAAMAGSSAGTEARAPEQRRPAEQ